ncbi:MAG: hypothetical protein ACREOH_16145, partial [Candidatus Entotheonellia bacterium]
MQERPHAGADQDSGAGPCVDPGAGTAGQAATYREITARLGVTMRAAYQHLRVLERKVGLASEEEAGRMRPRPEILPEAGRRPQHVLGG